MIQSEILIKNVITFLIFLNYLPYAFGQEIKLGFVTKDFQNEKTPLINRLDEDKNYVIIFYAFWHSPTNNLVANKYAKVIDKYRKEHNLELILINDEHFDNIKPALDRIKSQELNFNLYLTNDIYDSLGIKVVPTYYFLPKGESAAMEVTSNFIKEIDDFYIKRGFSSFFDNSIAHTIIDKSCNTIFNKIGGESPKTIIGPYEYYTLGRRLIRSGITSNTIYTLNPSTNMEEVLFDYQVELCDTMVLKDQDGDQLVLRVEEINNSGNDVEIITNAMIMNPCGETTPFILSPKYGSNAGYYFDIDGDSIVTILSCQYFNDELSYQNPNFEHKCLTTNIDQTQISIYPNPSNGILNLKTDTQNQITDLQICNSVGNTVYQSTKMESLIIDLRYLPNGYYTYTITNLGLITRGKFIINQ